MITNKYPSELISHIALYEFESHGPKGVINKIIECEYLEHIRDNTPVFNLAFGDKISADLTFTDLTISNNQDRDKILATVAATVMVFTDPYKKVAIHVEGSTRSRTRLYQMSINAYKKEIEKFFKILGYKNQVWKKFESGINYDELLLIKN